MLNFKDARKFKDEYGIELSSLKEIIEGPFGFSFKYESNDSINGFKFIKVIKLCDKGHLNNCKDEIAALMLTKCNCIVTFEEIYASEGLEGIGCALILIQ